MIASTIIAHILVFVGMLILCFVSFYYVRYTYLKNSSSNVAKPIVDNFNAQQLDDLLSSSAGDLADDSKNSQSSSPTRFKPYLAVAFIPIAITLTAIPTVYKNRHLFLPKVQLTKEDVQSLPNIRHQLIPINAQQYKPKKINTFSRPIILVGEEDFTDSWKSFIAENSDTVVCKAILAVSCNSSKIRKIFIIDMRGRRWEQVLVLLKQGHNVIAYGADDNFDSRIASVLGLRSSSSENSKTNFISLVNDKELTLGITHPTPLFVGSSATTITINSDNPQAISMLPDGLPGGFSVSRLHAKSFSNGRFIWMDFLPNLNSVNNKGNANIYEQVMSNIVRYIDDKEYQSIATWPKGKKSAAYLAVEATKNSIDFQRLLNSSKNQKIPLTSFLSSQFTFENRDTSSILADIGEIGCMTHRQDVLSRYSMLDQTKRMAHCKKVIKRVLGEDVNGLRPPQESFNQNTLNSLINSGLHYIFAAQTTDSRLPQISESQTGDRFVRIPRLSSDGFLLWGTLELNNDAALKRLIDEFDWTQNSGGLFGFTFNSNQITSLQRASVITSLSRVINQNDTYFSTLGDLADWWLIRQLLADQSTELSSAEQQLIRKFKPAILYVDAAGKLNKKLLF